jgi:hypothetical protein
LRRRETFDGGAGGTAEDDFVGTDDTDFDGGIEEDEGDLLIDDDEDEGRGGACGSFGEIFT